MERENSHMINIGLIGHGRVAARHADAIQKIEGARLWSVAGRDLVRVSQFAEQFGACASNPSFTDISTMLSDPKLDAVIITTPDKQHASNILYSLAANKSVLVEKPMCTDLTEGELILKANTSHQTVAVGYHLRWHNGLRKIAIRCHNKEFGQLRHLKLTWGVSFFGQHKWRTDLIQSRWLCLTVLGTHLIDIARWLMVPLCGEIVHTESKVTNQKQSIFDESVMATFTFESGAICELNCSVMHDEPFQLELSTEHAHVIGYDLAGDNRKILINKELLVFEKNNPYIAQLVDFIQTLQQKKEPEVGVVEALCNVKQLHKIWPE